MKAVKRPAPGRKSAVLFSGSYQGQGERWGIPIDVDVLETS